MAYEDDGYGSSGGGVPPKPSQPPGEGMQWVWDGTAWVTQPNQQSPVTIENQSYEEAARVSDPSQCPPGTTAKSIGNGMYSCVYTPKTDTTGSTGSTGTTTQQPTAPTGPGLPTPERFTFTAPGVPTAYSSTYQPQTLQGFTGVGEADRNRLMQAILQSPETMGQTQQDQLFEQQKELLNAQRQQQQAQLSQNLAQRGLSGLGGAALAGQMAIGQDFSGQLLGAQRDIAIKAATQNRADQLAALQMQDAMAQGDYQRMAQIYQANQQERANTENFLRQAAELTQQGQMQYNQQRLAQEAAQQQEIMDFYTFLENQRKALTDANLMATQIALAGR